MLNTDDLTMIAETRRLPSADRNMGVTPLDMRQTKFATSMRGYERAEVNAFLLEAADGYEQALRENDRLRQDIARLEASLNQYREMEGGLKSTLLSAQRVADDMRENAQKMADDMRENAQKIADDMREHATQEATRIVREAEGRAEMAIQRAHGRLEDIQREIDGLKMKRRETEVNLGSLITTLQNTLEFIREQDDREQRVVLHPSTPLGAGRPRVEAAS
jgi:cell division initiation protein